MSAADLLGLIVSAAVAAYLLYALLRGGAVLAVFQGWIQNIVFAAVLFAIVPLLGGYLARVFTYDARRPQTWKGYAGSLIVFSAVSWLALYSLLRTRMPWDLGFNTTSSFVTNTNWQFYAGETTLTGFVQMIGLAVQNFLSAGVGIVVAIALFRGIASRPLGNFFEDLTRVVLRVLLPISFAGALILASQGVVQSLSLPVASQEIIKELGTNGGGFFNVNSAMPFENPNGLTNFLEMLAMLSIPASLTYTYGRMVGSHRQGWTIFGAMFVLLAVSVTLVYLAESDVTPAQHAAGVVGANLEGKEVRFGTAGSSLWTAVTTATSTGAVNSAFESLTGLGGLVPMVNLAYGESAFGGVGTGMYTMLLYALLAVFIGGLMVGRTPEYLGKKIEAREIKLVVLGLLFTPLAVLVTTSLAMSSYGAPSIVASGPQGFSESLYAYLSQANNNGSAFAGYTGVTFADLLGGMTMMLARFIPIVFTLAVAGAMVSKRVGPAGLGTMRTDTPTFAGLLIGVVVLIGALTFLPALLLGPVVQGMTDRLF